MTVAEANALLYLPGHPRRELERALRIPAFSPGWRSSFQALLDAESSGRPLTGNAGLSPTPAAAPGFRTLRVAQVTRESASVTSFVLESAEAPPLPVALPGQFVVVRMRPTPDGPPMLRSYSLSGPPGAARYRISVKLEPHGAGSGYLHGRVRAGDLLDVSGPRGTLHARAGARARSSCSAPASERRRCSRCCMRSRAPDPCPRCGGCTGRATAPSTRSRASRASCSIGCRGVGASSCTAGRPRRTAGAKTST